MITFYLIRDCLLVPFEENKKEVKRKKKRWFKSEYKYIKYITVNVNAYFESKYIEYIYKYKKNGYFELKVNIAVIMDGYLQTVTLMYILCTRCKL